MAISSRTRMASLTRAHGGKARVRSSTLPIRQRKHGGKGRSALAVKAGADGFKDDDAEGNFQGDARFADGTDPRLMRNRYAVLYNRAMEEVIQNQLHGNGILFIRSATVGNQNLAMLWGGDNESNFSPENGLPTVVTAGLGAGISGMALWTADLGGYLTPKVRARPKAFHALDRVQRLFAHHGAAEHFQSWAVGLWRRGLQQLPQVCRAPYESFSVSLCRSAGGSEDRDADHAGPGAGVSKRPARPRGEG